jgi:diguanylate cyclase (GGDEF)-like protein
LPTDPRVRGNLFDYSALEKNVAELHKLSITDNLTNIYNRRYFFEVSQNLILIAVREKKPLSLLMLDIDHFKNINDTFGHQVGDFILIDAVREIEKIMRESDIFSRVGGEEFTVLLNDTLIDGARNIAEKIRTSIENKEFIYSNTEIKITVSVGIAQIDENNNSIEKLYKQADKQLYKAKHNGRNRVF